MKKFLSFLVLFVAIATARADVPKVLVYGKILSVTEAGLLVSCDPATHSHPTGYYNIGPSENRIVHVSGDPRSLYAMGRRGALALKAAADEALVAFVAHDPGEKYTYTTKAGPKSTVVSLTNADDLPPFSVVKATNATASPKSAQIAPDGPSRSQFGTIMDTPRYNLETEVKDLRIGLPADKVLRILGNPLHVNRSADNSEQWVYHGGYIYIDKGIVTAMQNYSGDVFDASWK